MADILKQMVMELEKLDQCLCDFAGFSDPDDPTFKQLSGEIKTLSPDELAKLGTSCGTRGNKPFSGKLCSLLRAEGISIRALLITDPHWGTTISALALKCEEARARGVERAVNRRGGSLRLEEDWESDGWRIFESE